MAVNTWKKRENEAGFPYYIRDESSVKQWDHPAFVDVISKMNEASDIRYAVYRMAYKIINIQEQLKVPCVRIISGVFAHHCLSISENSFVLEPCELEAILTDIYFAASKEGSFDGDIDLATELTLNFLLNVYDRERTLSVSVQSAKTCLSLLCWSSLREVWRYLFSTASDHNGCVRPRRLAGLLTQVAAVAEAVGEGATYGRHAVQPEVDRCFAKTPGMLGLSELGLLEWLGAGPPLLGWTGVRERLRQLGTPALHLPAPQWKCTLCRSKNPAGLKFKCTQCWSMLVCERCYLYNDVKPVTNKIVHRHKKSHVVKEIIDSQTMPSKCMIGLIRNFKKALNCQSTCHRGNQSSVIQYPLHGSIVEIPVEEDVQVNKENKDTKIPDSENRKVFTSTVGKASGKHFADPKIVLQDIIGQLESQNKALKSLSHLLNELQQGNSMDRRIQHKVDSHWGQIAVQINRLKMLKDNLLPGLSANISEIPGVDNATVQQLQPGQKIRMDVFEAFSPIPVLAKDCYNETTIMEHKNITRKPSNREQSDDFVQQRNITKGITPRVIEYYDDSISKVSMGDISMWFANVTDAEKADAKAECSSAPVNIQGPSCIPSGASSLEDKFNADLESVATSNNKMKELNADLDSVLDRLQSILANNFTLDETSFDNTQLKETANEMEGLLGTLIRGVEQRRTIKGDKI